MKLYALNTSVFDDDKLFGEKFNTMSAYRKNKINSYSRVQDKRLSLAAGVLVDMALADFGLHERDMLYFENENGKPYFCDCSDIFFSLSHSGEWAIAVFSDQEIGCDIQKIKKVDLNIAKRFFAQDEYAYICESENRMDSFFSIWTKKESYIKAVGTGLSTLLSSFSVFETDEWSFDECDNITGYKIAVCSQKHPDENIIFCEVKI